MANKFIDVLSSSPSPPQSEGDSRELRVVMIGKTGTGKSATGNTLIGENVFESKGSSKSCTKECKDEEKERFGKRLVVVDTPGFLDTNMSHKELVEHLVSCTCFTNPGIHAFLLVVRVGHRFIEEDQKAIASMKELFCQKFANHTVVVFTGKCILDEDGETLENYIEELPQALRQMISSCKGGTIAISNRGTHDEREQEARKIINKVKEVVRKNGGESQYYKTAMSVAISKDVAENTEKIMKANVKIRNIIRLLEQEKERLYGEDPRVKQNRLNLEKNIEKLWKELIDKATARKMAIEDTRRKWISPLDSVFAIGTAVVGVVALIGTLLAKAV